MYLLYLFITIALIISYSTTYKGNKKDCPVFLAHFLTCLGPLLISGVLWVFVIFIGGSIGREYKFHHTKELVVMGDGSTIEGSFFIGSGYIKEKMVYNYYMRGDDGGMSRESINASRTVIYEVDNLTEPHIDVYTDHSEFDATAWFPIQGCGCHEEYKVYLPTGSVIKEIKLDNQ